MTADERHLQLRMAYGNASLAESDARARGDKDAARKAKAQQVKALDELYELEELVRQRNNRTIGGNA